MINEKRFFKIDVSQDVDKQAEAIAERIINESNEPSTISIKLPPNATYEEKIKIIADTLWNAGVRVKGDNDGDEAH